MHYRDLHLSFQMAEIEFTILSIGKETILTPFPGHSHGKNSYELHYIKDGRGTVIADGSPYKVAPGTFFVTGPEVFHEQVSESDDPMVEYGLYLQVRVPENLKKSHPMAPFLNTPFYICDAGEAPAFIMEEIFWELKNKPYGYELMLAALIQKFLLCITRLYDHTRTLSKSSLSANSPADLTFLTIEEAFLYDYRDLSLSELAERVNLSPRQTQRLLEKHYGMTFSGKKTQARMSAALLLLRNTEKSIREISEELGFSSPEHFTNAFKKYYGKTPGIYRKAPGEPN